MLLHFVNNKIPREISFQLKENEQYKILEVASSNPQTYASLSAICVFKNHLTHSNYPLRNPICFPRKFPPETVLSWAVSPLRVEAMNNGDQRTHGCLLTQRPPTDLAQLLRAGSVQRVATFTQSCDSFFPLSLQSTI